MGVATYPIPRAVVAAAAGSLQSGAPRPIEVRLAAGGSLAESDLRHLASDSDAVGSRWARRVCDGLDSRRDVIVASAFGDVSARHFGVLDPRFNDYDVVSWVVRASAEGIERWRGGDWEPVIASLQPAGARFVVLEGPILAEVAAAMIAGAGSVILHAGTPRAWYGGSASSGSALVAAASDGEGRIYALVDELDTTAVLDLIRVTPGPVAWVRRGASWDRDNALLSRLRGVDPPVVVEIDPADVESVTAQVDAYDASHPVSKATKKPLTASSGASPKAAGLAVVAADTGRVFLLQRALDPPDLICPVCDGSGNDDDGSECGSCDGSGELEPDPAAGRWEFPGGRLDPDEDPYEAARREFAEETGQPAPDGELVSTWDSPDGIYRGHVVLVDGEHAIAVHPDVEPRGTTVNPDDPDGDRREALAWFDLEHLEGNPALRDELAETLGIVLPHLVAARAVTAAGASPPPHTFMPPVLVKYWSAGAGAAKIRWGVGGDFNRCRRHLAKYLRPGQIAGACANLHKIATGTWPGPSHRH
jgi:8-oxo-dGTP pyrophosphatase MutT (NUDIX family)